MKLATLLLLAIFSQSAKAADEFDQAEFDAVTQFIADITTYEGMFYSVIDFCGPPAGKTIASTSETMWRNTNQDLLGSLKVAEERYLAMMNGPEERDAAAAQLEKTKQFLFDNARSNDRLYKELVDLEDKMFACSKKLGAMNSRSFAFENIAPESHSYWQSSLAD